MSPTQSKFFRPIVAFWLLQSGHSVASDSWIVEMKDEPLRLEFVEDTVKWTRGLPPTSVGQSETARTRDGTLEFTSDGRPVGFVRVSPTEALLILGESSVWAHPESDLPTALEQPIDVFDQKWVLSYSAQVNVLVDGITTPAYLARGPAFWLLAREKQSNYDTAARRFYVSPGFPTTWRFSGFPADFPVREENSRQGPTAKEVECVVSNAFGERMAKRVVVRAHGDNIELSDLLGRPLVAPEPLSSDTLETLGKVMIFQSFRLCYPRSTGTPDLDGKWHLGQREVQVVGRGDAVFIDDVRFLPTQREGVGYLLFNEESVLETVPTGHGWMVRTLEPAGQPDQLWSPDGPIGGPRAILLALEVVDPKPTVASSGLGGVIGRPRPARLLEKGDPILYPKEALEENLPPIVCQYTVFVDERGRPTRLSVDPSCPTSLQDAAQPILTWRWDEAAGQHPSGLHVLLPSVVEREVRFAVRFQ